jgi:hypothetical protein
MKLICWLILIALFAIAVLDWHVSALTGAVLVIVAVASISVIRMVSSTRY